MAVYTNAGGGGGTSSDELTATKGDVLKGKTAVTSDSNDEAVTGTLELTGNLLAADAKKGATFYNTDAKKKETGTLEERTSAYEGTGSLDGTNKRLQLAVPARAIYAAASKLYATYANIASLIGLTAAKLAQGQTVLGMTGTYKGRGNATAAQVLTGRTFSTASLDNASGTMPNQGAKTASLNAGGSYVIPAGYHNGSGKVTANSLSSQTSATAAAGNILSGKTAWVNGSRITGTMTNRGAAGTSLKAGGSYTIPAGYHNGSGKVTANSLASQTSATAAAGHILSGKTAWVNGSKVTGNIASMGGQTITPGASQQTVSCSGKYMTGNITIKGVGIYESKYIMGICKTAIEYGTFISISGIVGSIDRIYFHYGINYGTTDSQWQNDVNNTFAIPHKFGRFTGSPILDGQYHWYYTGTQNGTTYDGSDYSTEFLMSFSGGTFSIKWRAGTRMSICGHLLIITRN